MRRPRAGRRVLPRGYIDFVRQLAIWFGFYVAYQIVRGVADRDSAEAFDNGWKVIDLERRVGSLWELSLQGFLGSSETLIRLTSWTYWLSQFAVVGVALLWIYFRNHERFADFRNWLIGANLVGLVGAGNMAEATLTVDGGAGRDTPQGPGSDRSVRPLEPDVWAHGRREVRR